MTRRSRTRPPVRAAATAASSQRREHHLRVVVGNAKIKIRAGQHKTVRIELNPTGRHLLVEPHRLRVKLTLTPNGHTVRSRTITLTAKPPPQHKHH